MIQRLSNSRHCNVGSMLGRRRRRRANIEPTLIQCFVLAGDIQPFTLGSNAFHIAKEYRHRRYHFIT